MRIIKTVKVSPENYEALFALPCVTSVTRDGDLSIIVTLSKEHTRGNLRAASGDYIVQFASGEWQRFGPVAFNHLTLNPKCKPWEMED